MADQQLITIYSYFIFIIFFVKQLQHLFLQPLICVSE